ncbi:hypothetical protein T07_6728 [Trichinella nelsoni]|uniref:Uncharacterized protein n=1 Tax=Trichinella nelsoni TaxID=6336 RepID=A0A0V0SA52_9BILA|nr:hypothetical protein T07_6728 [Trichinella nelsoni]
MEFDEIWEYGDEYTTKRKFWLLTEGAPISPRDKLMDNCVSAV